MEKKIWHKTLKENLTISKASNDNYMEWEGLVKKIAEASSKVQLPSELVESDKFLISNGFIRSAKTLKDFGYFLALEKIKRFLKVRVIYAPGKEAKFQLGISAKDVTNLKEAAMIQLQVDYASTMQQTINECLEICGLSQSKKVEDEKKPCTALMLVEPPVVKKEENKQVETAAKKEEAVVTEDTKENVSVDLFNEVPVSKLNLDNLWSFVPIDIHDDWGERWVTVNEKGNKLKAEAGELQKKAENTKDKKEKKEIMARVKDLNESAQAMLDILDFQQRQLLDEIIKIAEIKVKEILGEISSEDMDDITEEFCNSISDDRYYVERNYNVPLLKLLNENIDDYKAHKSVQNMISSSQKTEELDGMIEVKMSAEEETLLFGDSTKAEDTNINEVIEVKTTEEKIVVEEIKTEAQEVKAEVEGKSEIVEVKSEAEEVEEEIKTSLNLSNVGQLTPNHITAEQVVRAEIANKEYENLLAQAKKIEMTTKYLTGEAKAETLKVAQDLKDSAENFTMEFNATNNKICGKVMTYIQAQLDLAFPDGSKRELFAFKNRIYNCLYMVGAQYEEYKNKTVDQTISKMLELFKTETSWKEVIPTLLTEVANKKGVSLNTIEDIKAFLENKKSVIYNTIQLEGFPVGLRCEQIQGERLNCFFDWDELLDSFDNIKEKKKEIYSNEEKLKAFVFEDLYVQLVKENYSIGSEEEIQQSLLHQFGTINGDIHIGGREKCLTIEFEPRTKNEIVLRVPYAEVLEAFNELKKEGFAIDIFPSEVVAEINHDYRRGDMEILQITPHYENNVISKFEIDLLINASKSYNELLTFFIDGKANFKDLKKAMSKAFLHNERTVNEIANITTVDDERVIELGAQIYACWDNTPGYLEKDDYIRGPLDIVGGERNRRSTEYAMALTGAEAIDIYVNNVFKSVKDVIAEKDEKELAKYLKGHYENGGGSFMHRHYDIGMTSGSAKGVEIGLNQSSEEGKKSNSIFRKVGVVTWAELAKKVMAKYKEQLKADNTVESDDENIAEKIVNVSEESKVTEVVEEKQNKKSEVIADKNAESKMPFDKLVYSLREQVKNTKEEQKETLEATTREDVITANSKVDEAVNESVNEAANVEVQNKVNETVKNEVKIEEKAAPKTFIELTDKPLTPRMTSTSKKKSKAPEQVPGQLFFNIA